ncbi:MAG: glycosyltransferase family 2 protein [Alphaproteobacteria bacterium]
MIPISVFIITKNEADRIGNIIKAVQSFADEIIIIDSGSIDETKKICEDLGVKFIFNSWQGYGPQKIFGENICKNQWLLNIDADEEVSEELANEIIGIFGKEISPEIAGFKIKIFNKFRFETKPHKLAYYYNQLRLYNKNLAGFKNSTVHDSVILKDTNHKILQLKNIIYHQSFRDFTHWIEKINSYASMQAKDAVLKNKNVGFLKILLAPTLAFFKAFFIRRYFIYGFNGIIYSYLYAFSRFLKMVKIREEFQANKFKNSL